MGLQRLLPGTHQTPDGLDVMASGQQATILQRLAGTAGHSYHCRTAPVRLTSFGMVMTGPEACHSLHGTVVCNMLLAEIWLLPRFSAS